MSRSDSTAVAFINQQIKHTLDNVVDLPSDSRGAAIQSLLELIAEIRRGDVIGVSVVKTMHNLAVTSSRLLET